MTPNLKDRIAVVTGASRGIGYFTALELARAGAHTTCYLRRYCLYRHRTMR